MSQDESAKQSAAAEDMPMEDMPELVIVSGMSGAGRTEAMHVFEDLGYFCVDNLPASLIGNLFELGGMAELPGQPAGECRIAVVCDARNRSFFSGLTDELHRLDARGIEYRILFLDASDDRKLIARYKSSRRRHPAVRGRHEHRTGHPAGAQPALRSCASWRNDVIRHHRHAAAAVAPPPSANCSPPGTEQAGAGRHGVLVRLQARRARRTPTWSWTSRFLPNPYYDQALRPLDRVWTRPCASSSWAAYRDYRSSSNAAGERFSDCVMPGYVAEGKQQLAIGRGMHRGTAPQRGASPRQRATT